MRYEITFKNIVDIRMGSPFNGAKVELRGDFVPLFTNETFQDIYTISNDGLICFLVEWVHINNNPAFRVWKIDARQRNVLKSNRIEGCCKGISWTENCVDIIAWSLEKGDFTIKIFESEFFQTPPDLAFIFYPSVFKKMLHDRLILDMANDILLWTKDDVKSFLDENAPGEKIDNSQIQSILKELEKEGLIHIIGREDRYLASSN
jgi:hypothetical protein